MTDRGSTLRPRQPAFRMVRDGLSLPGADVTRAARIGNRDLNDVIDPNAVIDPHRADLNLHFDYHDVFIVQIGGSKRCRVWEPLPRTIEPVKGKHRIAVPRLDELGAPSLDITLRVGDCLYLPRGFPHAAQCFDTESHHLTIGMTAIGWHRVVRLAIDAEVATGRLSASLPISLLEPDAPTAVEKLDVDGVCGRLSDDVLRQWMAREIWRRQLPTRVKPLHPPALTGEPLRFTPDRCCGSPMLAGALCSGSATACPTCPTERCRSTAHCSPPPTGSPRPTCAASTTTHAPWSCADCSPRAC